MLGFENCKIMKQNVYSYIAKINNSSKVPWRTVQTPTISNIHESKRIIKPQKGQVGKLQSSYKVIWVLLAGKWSKARYFILAEVSP